MATSAEISQQEAPKTVEPFEAIWSENAFKRMLSLALILRSRSFLSHCVSLPQKTADRRFAVGSVGSEVVQPPQWQLQMQTAKLKNMPRTNAKSYYGHCFRDGYQCIVSLVSVVLVKKVTQGKTSIDKNREKKEKNYEGKVLLVNLLISSRPGSRPQNIKTRTRQEDFVTGGDMSQ